jgi:hypothetical protein
MEKLPRSGLIVTHFTRPQYARRMALSLAALIAAALATVWAVIVGTVSVAVGVRWARRIAGRRAERIEAQRRRLAELAAHADEQNRLLMESDDRGIYGEFPPAAI